MLSGGRAQNYMKHAIVCGMTICFLSFVHQPALNCTIYTLEDDDAATSTAENLCPEADFVTALRFIGAFLPGAIARAGGVSSIIDFHKSINMNAECLIDPIRPAWPKSNSQIILNAGFGTTGTRMLSCVASTAGVHATHNPFIPRSCMYLPGESNVVGKSCTEYMDELGFVSDSKVVRIIDKLMATHKGVFAGGLLSLRDPWEWQKSRLLHHRGARQMTYNFSSVCGPGSGGTSMPVFDTRVPRAFLAVNAFSACMIRRHSGSSALFALNLFAGIPNELPTRLAEFLSGRGAFANVSSTDLLRAFEHCNGRRNSTG